MPPASRPIDDLDRKLLVELPEVLEPSMLELARRLGVARNTAAARVARLVDTGVVTGYQPEIELSRLGYVFGAFSQISIEQGMRVAVVAALRKISEVLEAHITTGEADLLCRVVATDHDHLRDVLEAIQEIPGVVRTHTTVILSTEYNDGPTRLLEHDH